MDDQYQTVREIADLLKVSEATVRRWIKDGELRAIDIGKEWRIGSSDLDGFLQGHATRPVGTSISDGAGAPLQKHSLGEAPETRHRNGQEN